MPNSTIRMTESANQEISLKVKIAVLVAALGYFVDAFDLLLFSMLRVTSLTELGLSGEDLLVTGKWLINCQMWGMILGGLFWGILGDRVGRIQALFGSIFIYSTATFLNAYVTDTTEYAILRFIAGIGLAGELGGGIALISELLPKEKRGIGTTIITCIGISGVVAAGLVGKAFPWRTTYMIGGAMGFVLLFLRVGVNESGIFSNIKDQSHILKGDLRLLFGTKDRILRYLSCIAIATPTWFVVAILMTFCAEIGVAKGIQAPLNAADALMWTYAGMTAGDLACGLMSQLLKSRKKAVLYFLVCETILVIALMATPITEPWQFYAFCVPLGFFIGYWVVFVTTAAEQFGTNLRATVATSVPNFVRATTIPMTSSFVYLKTSGFTTLNSAMTVGCITFFIAYIGLYKLSESFALDMDYLEK